ncbi:MAG: leucyl aminopeptidase [Candidatus Melainabacteria bacterium]
MKITATTGDITQARAEAIIVNLFEGVTKPGGGTGAVDKALGGLIADELKHGKLFSGKLGDTLVLNTAGQLPARYVIVVGLGKAGKLTAFELRRASAAAVNACNRLKVKSAATLLHGAGTGGFEAQTAARTLAEGALLGNYRFTRRKTTPKAEAPSLLESLSVVEAEKSKLAAVKKGLAQGEIVGRHTNEVRDLVNDSANYVTPTYLKKEAQAASGKSSPLSCNVLEFKDIKRLKMGMFELVAKGSDEPPYLIHLSYKPKGKAKKKVALVGKGLTFDSGGLSLKPAGSMETMKMDMGGAAVVLAVMKAIAALDAAGFPLPIQVDGFMGTCENMPSGRSSKPGDIVTSMRGKTVEVNNTDAEGRLVLGDVLHYAQKTVKPDELIDLATLTGAVVVALGEVACGIMGPFGVSDTLVANLQASGKAAGEKLWQLPLYEEYKSGLKSDVADLINAGSKGQAGTCSAGLFLKEFVDDDQVWAHLDIAGAAWVREEFPELKKGASGFGVRTLLYYLYGLN